MLPLSILIIPGGIGGSGGGAGGVIVNPSISTTDVNFVTFRRATYGTDTHGGPTPTYPNSVTMLATVVLSGVPVRLLEHEDSEKRPLSRTTLKITTSEDPKVYLGQSLKTLDLVDWGGLTANVVGTSIQQAGIWLTIAELTK